MEEKKFQPKRLSTSNTKQEMLEAYNSVLRQLEAQRELEMKPEKKLEEKKAKEVIQVADSLSTEGITKETSNLKIETGKMLAQISDRMGPPHFIIDPLDGSSHSDASEDRLPSHFSGPAKPYGCGLHCSGCCHIQ